MKKIDHIGIAVLDLDASEIMYQHLLQKSPTKREFIDSEKVEVSFFDLEETKIELLSSSDQNSAIAKFITKKGEGIHHIAFEVADLETEIKRLTALGFSVIDTPKIGADNRLIVFLHPKNTNGTLIELCMKI